jgi:acyl-CoA thioesterase-1
MRIIAWVLIIAFFSTGVAKAQIVALGASNTRAYDLSLSDAWPAKLETLLRAGGHNVSVSNQGINGDISTGMLQRFASAVPAGIRVLILECCGNDNKNTNARFAVADHLSNIKALVSKARARGIAVVFLSNIYENAKDSAGIAAAQDAGAQFCGGVLQGVPDEHRRPSRDGIHADAIGNDIVAHRVLPCVLKALSNGG